VLVHTTNDDTLDVQSDFKRQCVFDRLEVNWPLLGGETQRFKDLPIDCYIAIVEGEEKWK
jgi:hypothetical protein